MPLRRGRAKAGPASDPLTACLDANGTYVCTSFNPRCYIIQKVTTTTPVSTVGYEPVEYKAEEEPEVATISNWCSNSSYEYLYPDLSYQPSDGYVYMNGDVGKMPSGAVYSATPESSAILGSMPDFIPVNGVAEGAEGLGPIPPSASQENASQPNYPISQLKQLLSQQLEYYFSRENLANDTYLLSQMDNDQYVPIWTVANFNQVKKLTKDIKLITEVLKESPNVQVDEEGVKVRPNHKRCIVILREIPDNTPVEDVKNLFAGESCPRFISCEFAHNSSWYVTFESDEDAQRAYRYLREEVREFQDKPIMARIKAKPMNRLVTLPPTVNAPKNGFRATPPPTAVYDPAAYPPGQQRFIYTNGTPGQPVAYTNPVHVYPPYQQQYYPSVMPGWPGSTPYFDISSVFQVNGLAPQTFKPPYRNNTRPRKQSRMVNQSDQSSQSSIQGGSNGNSNQGNSRQVLPQVPPSVSPQNAKGNSGAKGQPLMGDMPRSSHINSIGGDNHDAHSNPSLQIGIPIMHSNGMVDMYRFLPTPIPVAKEAVPPRHRRKKKDEETAAVGNSPGQSQAKDVASRAQFDLEDSAFPPLPGLEISSQTSTKQGAILHAETIAQSTTIDTQPQQSHWGENRLADVVKGTARAKGSSSKESNNSSGDNDSPRATSPQTAGAVTSTLTHCTQTVRQSSSSGAADNKDASESGDIQLSTVTLTPPSSPEKLVPVLTKCTMADKSTKTDDVLLNGDLDVPCPTTTNAATMTTVAAVEASSRSATVSVISNSRNHSNKQQDSRTTDAPKQSVSPPTVMEHPGNPPRMSYAQVAQHHKEATAQKEKQAKERPAAEVGQTANGKSNVSTSTGSGRVQSDREARDSRDNGQAAPHKESGNQQQRHSSAPNRLGSSRAAGHERSQRRRPEARTSQLRDYVTARSPK